MASSRRLKGSMSQLPYFHSSMNRTFVEYNLVAEDFHIYGPSCTFD